MPGHVETPIEETMEALHDAVKAGKILYLGGSSMFAWQFAELQLTAEKNGWTKFISMQNHYNLSIEKRRGDESLLFKDRGRFDTLVASCAWHSGWLLSGGFAGGVRIVLKDKTEQERGLYKGDMFFR